MTEEEEEEEPTLKELIEEERPPPQEPQKTDKEKKKRRFNLEAFRPLAEALKWITRANLGLDIEPDQYEGMMNVKDKRERTRITVRRIKRSTYCRILASVGAKAGGLNPYAIFVDVAEMEDTYFIAKDGEQRKEAILLKREQQPQPTAVTNVSLPAVQTKPPEKKGGIFHRNRGGEENQ